MSDSSPIVVVLFRNWPQICTCLQLIIMFRVVVRSAWKAQCFRADRSLRLMTSRCHPLWHRLVLMLHASSHFKHLHKCASIKSQQHFDLLNSCNNKDMIKMSEFSVRIELFPVSLFFVQSHKSISKSCLKRISACETAKKKAPKSIRSCPSLCGLHASTFR